MVNRRPSGNITLVVSDIGVAVCSLVTAAPPGPSFSPLFTPPPALFTSMNPRRTTGPVTSAATLLSFWKNPTVSSVKVRVSGVVDAAVSMRTCRSSKAAFSLLVCALVKVIVVRAFRIGLGRGRI